MVKYFSVHKNYEHVEYLAFFSGLGVYVGSYSHISGLLYFLVIFPIFVVE